MARMPAFACSFLVSTLLAGQAATQPPSARTPTPQEVRVAMGIPSTDALRGQQDTMGYASTAQQMAQVWALAEALPGVEAFGPLPAPGVAGALLPHDDYIYAGRMYRRMVPLVAAKTVVLVGAFHKYRRFPHRGRVVFDADRPWRGPDGEIPGSSLRKELLAALPEADVAVDGACHDSEHSLEAIAYWLKHQRSDVEILPVILPSASFERLQILAGRFGAALATAMKARGWQLGRDVAIVISSDGSHYGRDFKYTPFGEGGVEAYLKTLAQDRALVQGPLAGPITPEKARTFFAACVNPEQPDEYRATWCGRFSVPFGLLLLEATARNLGQPAPTGLPAAFGNSLGTPELPVKALGLGATAPANLYHFVSYPGVAWVGGDESGRY